MSCWSGICLYAPRESSTATPGRAGLARGSVAEQESDRVMVGNGLHVAPGHRGDDVDRLQECRRDCPVEAVEGVQAVLVPRVVESDPRPAGALQRVEVVLQELVF